MDKSSHQCKGESDRNHLGQNLFQLLFFFTDNNVLAFVRGSGTIKGVYNPTTISSPFQTELVITPAKRHPISNAETTSFS